MAGDLKQTITARHDRPADGYETLAAVVGIEPDFVVDRHIHPGTGAGHVLEARRAGPKMLFDEIDPPAWRFR